MPNENITNQPIFTRSVNTESLITHIRDHRNDEIITYESLNAVIGKTGVKRPHEIDSALKALLNEQFVFATLRGVGIRLATSDERCDLGPSLVNRVRRSSRKTMRKIATANPDEVDPHKYSSSWGMVAVIAASADRAIQKLIEQGKLKVVPLQPLTRQQLKDIFN